MSLLDLNSDRKSDLYTDPVDGINIAARFFGMNDSDEIAALIESTFPGWLLKDSPEYSKDYKFLQKNWEIICEHAKVEPRKIVIVDDIVFDTSHKLIVIFCEGMSKRGYVVRRKNELGLCTKCSRAIPTEEMWEKMQSARMDVPSVWSPKCSNC